LLIAIEVSAFDAARGGDVTLKIRCEIPRAAIVRKLAALVRDFPGRVARESDPAALGL
jgi:hypothetical protein